MTDFAEFKLQPEILRSLKQIGFESASPIQAKTIPMIQAGQDLIALAETGSGKTAACAIPVCDRVDTSRSEIQALIIVPTRELAVQYATETARIGKAKGVHVVTVVGGEGADLQRAKMKHNAQVCVATPGRLIDFIYRRQIDLTQVETLILDEADEMLSMGFVDDLEFVMDCLIHEHQTLLFSATMPAVIKKIAANRMKNPKEVSLITEVSSPKLLKHKFVYAGKHERMEKLAALMKEMRPKQSIVFCESRIDCEKVCRALRQDVNAVDFLHAGLPQEMRNSVTSKFRSGKILHLVATDVAARGLDFREVTHVFLYQLPRDPEVYVHRSGRTGRYGREGLAISFVGKPELHQLDRIIKLLKKEKADWIGNPPPAGTSRAPRSGSGPSKPRRGGPPRRPKSKPRSS